MPVGFAGISSDRVNLSVLSVVFDCYIKCVFLVATIRCKHYAYNCGSHKVLIGHTNEILKFKEFKVCKWKKNKHQQGASSRQQQTALDL